MNNKQIKVAAIGIIIFITIPFIGIFLSRFIKATDGEQFAIFMSFMFADIGIISMTISHIIKIG